MEIKHIIHPSFNRPMECIVLAVAAGVTTVKPFMRERRAGASMWADNTQKRWYRPVSLPSEKVASSLKELGL